MKKTLLSVVAAALAIVPAAAAAKPVPSLTPAATQRLWRAEVARAGTHTHALTTDSCRPARVVFYAQTDWLRLATKLAAQPSPCAQYYISVPPLTADKSQPRSGQASQIRALGPSFHALDEISWNGWSAWIAANDSTWYAAGATARQRMAAAGFSPAAGDSWALNELSSAVRAGTGVARANALEFMRGLASDGVKGAVFLAGVGQPTADTSTYQVNLQNWLQDGSFWSAASQYASDWAQESYGDIRSYAVGGASPLARRDAEVQYLGHELALANAGPDAAATARSFLQASYVAFGNAAWAWSSAYGWTAAPVESMQDFVSGQIYAARSLGAPSGTDRFGFAWSPSNTLGLTTSDYDAQTASLLDRIAAAIRDSGVSPDAACAPSWCATAVDGAAFAPAWASFASWAQTVPVFVDAAAGSLTVQLQTAGVVDGGAGARTVTFSSSSPTGVFSPSAVVTVPAGATAASVSYTDSTAGSPTIVAALAGGGSSSQVLTIAAPPSGGGGGGGGGAPPAPPVVTPPAPAPPPVAVPPQPRPAPRPHVTAVRTTFSRGHVVVTARVTAGTAPKAGARVLIRVRRGPRTLALVTRFTAKNGIATWRSVHTQPRARYSATAAVR